MKMACWNIRGVNSLFKQREIRSLIHSNNISLFRIIETQVQQENSIQIANDLLRGWRYVFNYNHHPNGRIWVFWNPDILDVSVLLDSDQLMHVEVSIIQKQISFLVSFSYGLHSRYQQCQLWQTYARISNSAGSQPWIILGDLNVVRKPEERIGGNLSWSSRSEDLDRCCSDLQLEDLRYSGHQFTWSKGEGDTFKARKLDRALVNHTWLNLFEGVEAIFLDPGASDHTHILVRLGIELYHRKSPFRFFNFWADSSMFLAIVEEAWNTQIVGSPPYRFCKKLKLVKVALKEFNRNHFSSIYSRSNQARANLHNIQARLRLDLGNEELKDQEHLALSDLIRLSNAEESLLKQKSRNLWIAEGDSNSAYFHNCIKARINSNKILSLTRIDNTTVYDMPLIH